MKGLCAERIPVTWENLIYIGFNFEELFRNHPTKSVRREDILHIALLLRNISNYRRSLKVH